MSWCFGRIGTDADQAGNAPLPPATLSVDSGAVLLRAGGPAATCMSGRFEADGGKPFEGWLVLGLGIDSARSPARLLNESDWAGRLASSEPDLDDLDGHYLIVRWSKESVELRADPLGMRTVHIRRTHSGVLFSTRLDWLATAVGGLSIDFAAFGAHWLAFNSFTSRSPLEGVLRLGQGGIATCSANGVEIRETPWNISDTDDPVNALDILDSLVAIGDTHDGGTTLGLSGGLDSRVLLALLIGGSHRFGLHVFGESAHPDVLLAGEIARSEGLELLHLDEPIPDLEDARRMLHEYIGAIGIVEPASAITKLRYYPRLAATGRVMIDGGMGEIARRQFANRLLRRGRAQLMRQDIRGMSRLLMLPRGDIFGEEITSAMTDGMIAGLEELVSTLPDPEVVGAENFVDLMICRSRFPYLAGMEQARVDGVLPNFMPFAQPSFLRSALMLPVEERRNGKLFRRIIFTQAPTLQHYNLVKNQIRYPYRLATVPAWLWTRGRKMMGGTYIDPSVDRFLELMRDDILEMVDSPEVRSYGPYDKEKLTTMVHSYYAGDTTRRGDLDWWLAFETWRRAIGAM